MEEVCFCGTKKQIEAPAGLDCYQVRLSKNRVLAGSILKQKLLSKTHPHITITTNPAIVIVEIRGENIPVHFMPCTYHIV